jgi:RecB family exonuclease
MLVDLRKRKAKAELEWAFDRQWIPVDWRDWDRAWLRIKTDVCADSVKPPTVDIVDWKTGKVHPEHAQQRSLYALGGLQLVQIGKLAGGSKDVKLTAQHVYVDTGQSATENYVMKDLAPLKREWMTRIKEMMADTEYRPNPGHACRWCKFSKLKGGPCKEG